MFDDRVYKRGALTLHALRLTIGDRPFFQLLRRWTAEHRYGSVDTADFVALAASVAALEDVSRESVTRLFDAWLFKTSLPDLPKPRR